MVGSLIPGERALFATSVSWRSVYPMSWAAVRSVPVDSAGAHPLLQPGGHLVVERRLGGERPRNPDRRVRDHEGARVLVQHHDGSAVDGGGQQLVLRDLGQETGVRRGQHLRSGGR